MFLKGQTKGYRRKQKEERRTRSTPLKKLKIPKKGRV
jgi:hypothetical protein